MITYYCVSLIVTLAASIYETNRMTTDDFVRIVLLCWITPVICGIYVFWKVVYGRLR